MSIFSSHPIMKEMFLYGSTNETQTMLAFTTYLQFCEGKYLMWNVEHKFLSSLNLIIITACKKNESNVEVYLPISSQFQISPQWMHQVNEKVETSTGTKKVKILICDGDSKSIGYSMECGLSTINNIEKKSCDKQSNFTKDKLFKKYASDIYKVATMKNKCIDHLQNKKSIATKVVLPLPEQETNIRDGVNLKTIDVDKMHSEKPTEKEPSVAGETKKKSICKFTKKITGQDDVISNEELSTDKKEEHLPYHIKEYNEKTIKDDGKIKHYETSCKLAHVALENNVSDEENKNNKSDQLTHTEKYEHENKKVTKSSNESSQQSTESEDTLGKYDVTNYSNIQEEKGYYKSIIDIDETLTDEKVGDILHEEVRENPVEIKELDHAQGQIPYTKIMESQEKDNSVVHEIPKGKIMEDLEHGKVEDKPDKTKKIDAIQGKACNKGARVTLKQDSPIMKDKFNQNKSKDQPKKVVTVTKEKHVLKMTNLNNKIQEIVQVLSSSEEETSDDENSNDNSSYSEDYSDVVEVSDDSNNEEIHVNKTQLSSCSSTRTSDNESLNSSSDSDIEEIKVVKNSCKTNIDQDKNHKIKQRHWTRRNSNGDDLEVLYEVDDRKCLLASQIVEVVYTNSLDTNDNDSTLSWSENNDEAVEIIFEKEKVTTKKKRHGCTYSDKNEIHRYNKKKK